MSKRIASNIARVKDWSDRNKNDLYIVSVVILTLLIVMGGVRLWMVRGQEMALIIRHNVGGSLTDEELNAGYMEASGLPGLIMASKRGTRFYYPWCVSGNRIKEANRVYFQNEEEATSAGYSIAKGCSGF